MFIILILIVSLSAQDKEQSNNMNVKDTQEISRAAENPFLNYELRGSIRTWINMFCKPPYAFDILQSKLKLELLAKAGEHAGCKALGYYSFDALNRTNIFDLQELYLDFYSEYFDARLGKQVLAWGKADEINPTDIFNPQDLSIFSEDKSLRKIGVLNLKTDIKVSDFFLECNWKPFFEGSRLPATNSPWAFFNPVDIISNIIHIEVYPGTNGLPAMLVSKITQNMNSSAFSSNNSTYSVPIPPLPKNAFTNTEYAVKFGGTIGILDFSLSFADVWDSIPTIQPYISNISMVTQIGPIIITNGPIVITNGPYTITNEIELTLPELVYKRTKMFGADFAMSLGPVGLWTEGAYFLTKDIHGNNEYIKNPYFQIIIGGDYTIPVIDFKINAQYFREIITKIDNDDEKFSEKDIISRLGAGLPVSEAISLRVERKFLPGEICSMSIHGIYDIKDKGYALTPKIALSPVDAFTIELGASLYGGNKKSLFGKFDKNDNFYMKGTYAF